MLPVVPLSSIDDTPPLSQAPPEQGCSLEKGKSQDTKHVEFPDFCVHKVRSLLDIYCLSVFLK